MSVFERGTGKLEITDAERIERLNSRVAKLQAENDRTVRRLHKLDGKYVTQGLQLTKLLKDEGNACIQLGVALAENAELEAELEEIKSEENIQNVMLTAENAKLEAELRDAEKLQEERDLIAQYLHQDPPFDTYAGVDLHERAAFYSTDVYAESCSADDYYKAFLDCCKEAIKEVESE